MEADSFKVHHPVGQTPAVSPGDTVPVLALNRREAAEALRISTRTLDELRAHGAIPSYKIGTRRLYSAAALAEWVQTQSAAQAVRQ